MSVNESDLEPEQDLTVQVYMRPGLLLEPLDAKLETLQRLETTDVIDAVTVQACSSQVPLTARGGLISSQLAMCLLNRFSPGGIYSQQPGCH